MVGSLSTCSIRNKNSSLVIQSCQPMNRKKNGKSFSYLMVSGGRKKRFEKELIESQGRV